MDIKPIHNAREHQQALDEIWRLWHAKPGTPEGERLELLSIIVNDYEDRHFKMPPRIPVRRRAKSAAFAARGRSPAR